MTGMFIQAQPIWLKDKKCEMNTYGVFVLETAAAPGAMLHITGATFYRVSVNGRFLGFGPARAAEGYAREDIFSLEGFGPECRVLIEASGYYCRSLSTVLQPSFLMAEIRCGDRVLAYTGPESPAFAPPCRIRKAERYSIQRHFCEVWDFRENRPLTDPAYRAPVEVLRDVPKLLERKAPLPEYKRILLNRIRDRGTLACDDSLPVRNGYSWSVIREEWGRFEEEEIPFRPWRWLQQNRQTRSGGEEELPVVLGENMYAVLDFGQAEAGFLTADLEALAPSDVVIGFSEYFSGEAFAFTKMNAHNALEYLLGEGTRRSVMSFEPYTFRFAIVAVKKGNVRLHSFGGVTFMFPVEDVALPDCGSRALNDIYRAAVRTFAHNAVDLYTDCPSRERAGWLCDSWFTARTEYELTGKTQVEDAFLENFRLYRNRGEFPEGMLPMCYPADRDFHGKFIPQWAMWYILEVEEYVRRRGHGGEAEAFRESVYGLLRFFGKYENEDGLLERLPSWNFVEWSEANKWTWDVSYPTNFLYGQVLECAWRLYGDEECRRKSGKVRRTATEQSFNGSYFLDHAVRDEEGRLRVMEHSSEACQYYAVLFGGVDPDTEKYSELARLIYQVFSPDRGGAMPQIVEANAFIGVYLRLEALLKCGKYDLALRDVEAFFSGMAERTGTLWEYRQQTGSYDHGFASYACVVIREALSHGGRSREKE